MNTRKFMWLTATALTIGSIATLTTNAQLVPVTVSAVPSGVAITVDGTNYTTPASFLWDSGSSHSLEAGSPQLSLDGHTRYTLDSWSDAGAPSHSITVPDASTNYTASFLTEYLLDVNLSPSTGGTVSRVPVGPWYASNQLVSLTASTNTGYRLSGWQGVDSQTANTAQVTVNGYRSVTAAFLPFDYPYINVTNNGAAAPGVLIGNIGGRTGDGTKTHYVVLDNTGTNALFANKTNTLWRFVTPQGFDAVGSSAGFNFKDETFSPVASYTASGYTLDTHDIKLLPNGHALLFAQEFVTVDMSKIVTNGKPAATITGNVIQEVDSAKRVVFEWRTLDHIAITNSFYNLSQGSIDYAHMNAVTIDPTDYNLLVSLRTTCEIVKINRQTGEVMWRLGGKANQFTFVGEHEENAPYYTVGQHDVHRLANGNLLYFDNGNLQGAGTTPSDRTYSRAVEYQLDEVNKVATLVWEFRHTPDISAGCTGSLKRFANGNTLIDWGCAVPNSGVIVTEVSPSGEVVFEMTHRQTNGILSVMLGGGLTKQVLNSPDLVKSTSFQGVVAGETYDSPVAGGSVKINNVSGATEIALVIERRLDAVRFPLFPGLAPQVLMEHVLLSGSNITSVQAELSLSLPDNTYAFDTPLYKDPAQVTVYFRPTPGEGLLVPLPTTYDSVAQKVKVTTSQMGEFIFTCPDLAQLPCDSVIVSPLDQAKVSQAAAVTLDWSPKGFAQFYDLQVATNADFSNLIYDEKALFDSVFTFTNLAPTTQYYWRVKTFNEGGSGEWVSASFTTVPSTIRVIHPNGGEMFRRNLKYEVLWTNTVTESVAIDLYKGTTMIRTLVTTANAGFYQWQTGVAGGPGNDYWIKIRSVSTPSMFDVSDKFFSMDVPVIDANSLVRQADGRVAFNVTAGAGLVTNVTVWGATELLPANWKSLGGLRVTNGTGVFMETPAPSDPARYYRVTIP